MEAANTQKWQSKAALQATEIKRLTGQVERLRKDKIKLLSDLKKLDASVPLIDRIEELEAKLARAECLLVDAMVQLENGKIKTRRNRAYLIGQFLAELKGQDDE